MSAKPEADRSEALSDTIRQRLDAAQGRYHALRRSYEHLLGKLEGSESAMAAGRPNAHAASEAQRQG